MKNTPIRATDPCELERRVLDPNMAKTEGEWWAREEIINLRQQFAECQASFKLKDEAIIALYGCYPPDYINDSKCVMARAALKAQSSTKQLDAYAREYAAKCFLALIPALSTTTAAKESVEFVEGLAYQLRSGEWNPEE